MIMNRIDTVQRCRRELVGGQSGIGKGRVDRDVEQDSSFQIEVRGFSSDAENTAGDANDDGNANDAGNADGAITVKGS